MFGEATAQNRYEVELKKITLLEVEGARDQVPRNWRRQWCLVNLSSMTQISADVPETDKIVCPASVEGRRVQ